MVNTWVVKAAIESLNPELISHKQISTQPIVQVKKREMYQKESELAFIEPNVDDADVLLAGLRPGVEGFLLSADEPAPEQIARLLAGRGQLDAVHVIAHGAPGAVRFAARVLSVETLDEHAAELGVIAQALRKDGGLLLWSCHTGQGNEGTIFVCALASAVHANVGAAVGFVGSEAGGGKWELDKALRVLHWSTPLTAQA